MSTDCLTGPTCLMPEIPDPADCPGCYTQPIPEPADEAESRANHHLLRCCDVCGESDDDRLSFDLESAMLLCVACKPNRPQLGLPDFGAIAADLFAEAF